MAGERVELHAYKPEWPGEFREISRRLRAAAGSRALRIDHIGSTAVPGLLSKNVIDVQVTVGSLEEAELTDSLEAGGFERRPHVTSDHRPPGETGPETDWQKLFFRNGEGQQLCHIHVRVVGRANQVYPLLVRDFLRAHPRSAEAYGRLKVLLAPRLERADYPDVKDPACDLIHEHARAWRAATGWQLGPSDG